jgi:hypothetical protein
VDAIKDAALIVLVLAFVGWRIVSAARTLSQDASARAANVALLIALASSIPVFLTVEWLTGKGPSAPEPSYAIRLRTIAVALIAWAVFVCWRGYAEYRAGREARLRFAEGKQCAVCGKPLNLKRLHHPWRDDQEMSDTWMNVCDQCGELTLFDATGRGRRIGYGPPDSSS